MESSLARARARSACRLANCAVAVARSALRLANCARKRSSSATTCSSFWRVADSAAISVALDGLDDATAYLAERLEASALEAFALDS